MLEWSRHIINMLLYKNGELLTLVSITVTLSKLVSQHCQLVSIFHLISTITYKHWTKAYHLQIAVWMNWERLQHTWCRWRQLTDDVTASGCQDGRPRVGEFTFWWGHHHSHVHQITTALIPETHTNQSPSSVDNFVWLISFLMPSTDGPIYYRRWKYQSENQIVCVKILGL